MASMDPRQAVIDIMTLIRLMIYLLNFSRTMALTKTMIFSKDFSLEEKEVIRPAIVRLEVSVDSEVEDSVFLLHFLIMMIFSKEDLAVLHHLFQAEEV